jgi:hypothetical protein
MRDGRVDQWVDLAGLAMVLLGLGVRVVAREWKVSHANGALVTSGPYALVRHPMYLGSLVAGMGVFIILGNLALTALFTLLFIGCHALVARREEAGLRQEYGAQFDAYVGRTPGWLPRPRSLISFPAFVRNTIPRSFTAVLRERTAIAWTFTAAAIAEVFSDTMTRGWTHADQKAYLWLPVVVVLLMLWAVTKPLASRLCERAD